MGAMFYDINAQMRDGSSRNADSLTEDAMALSPKVLLVMDGATVVNGDANHFHEHASDAHWLSHKGCAYVSSRFAQLSIESEKSEGTDSGEGTGQEDAPDTGKRAQEEINDVIYNTLCVLESEYEEATGRDCSTLTPADVPSSSLSCALAWSGSIYLIQLGDSPISAKMRDGSFLYMQGDERLIAFDVENKEKIGHLIAEGLKISEAHRKLSPSFCEVREKKCNTVDDSGYKIFCFCGKENAQARIERLEAEDVESIVIYSDGLADLLDFEEEIDAEALHDMCLKDLGAVLEQLREHQEEDAECKKVLRFKKSDDISVISARIHA